MSLFGFGRRQNEPQDDSADQPETAQPQPVQPSENQPAAPPPAETPSELPPPETEEALPPVTTTTPQPAAEPAAADEPQPYRSAAEHLAHELARIDLLVQAQTIRWQYFIADHKPEEYWGMIHVTHEEVDRYLGAGYYAPHELPDRLLLELRPLWARAMTMADEIAARVGQTEIVLPLVELTTTLELTSLEVDILLLTLLPEIDMRYRRLFGYLQDDASRTRPLAELVLQMVRPLQPDLLPGRAALAAEAPLRAYHLLRMQGQRPGDEGLSMGSLTIDPAIVEYLLGAEAIDERLQGEFWLPETLPVWPELILPARQQSQLEKLGEWVEESDQTPTFLLQGGYGSGRQTVAGALCQQLGLPLLVVDVKSGLAFAGGWKTFVDLVYRQGLLFDMPLYWSHCELLIEDEVNGHRPWHYLLTTAENHSGLTFLASTAGWELMGHFQDEAPPFLHLVFPVPNHELRRRHWQHHLEQESVAADVDVPLVAKLLANSFQFTGGQIADAVATARWLAVQRRATQQEITRKDLYDGCRRQASRQIIKMARRVQPRENLTLDKVILPPVNKRQLEELIVRVQNQNTIYSSLDFGHQLSLGKGLIALFVGSSGTGKTLTAELLASKQGVDLYKVDLSAVVSKYVGETEKNLNRVFNEAEGANAILFFDEADALFGKRGEVKDARDRWANMEINFLLQRIEEYDGVVILASNLRQNIDEAFSRRIHVIVEFPFPEAEHRLQILQGLFPDIAGLTPPPVKELRQLTEQFKLAGGNWKNIVIDAAFRALPADAAERAADELAVTITQRHLVTAIAREYQKLGKPLTPGEFGKAFYEWVKEDILLIEGKDESGSDG